MTTITKRCSVCGRFRAYDPDDVFCIGCGHEGLESECECGTYGDVSHRTERTTAL